MVFFVKIGHFLDVIIAKLQELSKSGSTVMSHFIVHPVINDWFKLSVLRAVSGNGNSLPVIQITPMILNKNTITTPENILTVSITANSSL